MWFWGVEVTWLRGVEKSIPTQIRQLILYVSNSEGSIDGFVGDSTFVGELTSSEEGWTRAL